MEDKILNNERLDLVQLVKYFMTLFKNKCQIVKKKRLKILVNLKFIFNFHVL